MNVSVSMISYNEYIIVYNDLRQMYCDEQATLLVSIITAKEIFMILIP